MKLKRAVKQTAGWAAALSTPFHARSSQASACILVYHRVADIGFTDPQLDDWNVPPARFADQIAELADCAEIVPLLDLPAHLAMADRKGKPLVCITFDDGYASVLQGALPVLKHHRIPATIFLVTKYIGSTNPLPFDRWAQKNHAQISSEAWRALDWKDLETCLASDLITLGAHSHTHSDARHCRAEQLKVEADISRQILLRRFGDRHAIAYAYPYGCTRLGEVTPEYVGAVRNAGYRLAVTTDLGLATAGSDLLRLPRVEAHRLDSRSVMKAKAMGALAPYKLTDRLRQAVRKG